MYVYNPDGSAYSGSDSNIFGGGGIFDSDEEGIILYTCPLNNPVDNGEGFIVVSDQKADVTDFEFFDRITLNHLGTLNIIGVSNTDGIASFPYPLPNYPYGIFAVINNDQTVVIVGWDIIFNQISNITDNKEINFYLPGYQLYQNYPNPFNPSTKISWQSPVGSHQTLKVYDVLGNEITTLIDNVMNPGYYITAFDGSKYASGLYFARLTVQSKETKPYIKTIKMLMTN